jgi:cyclophilin family peptidyl-prolyl cis-trans isomerase
MQLRQIPFRHSVLLIVVSFLSCSKAKPIEQYKRDLLRLEINRVSAIDSFSVFLNNPNPSIVSRALSTMSKIQDSTFVPIFAKFLTNQDSTIRLKAIEGLGQSFHASAAEALRVIIENKSASIFRSAAILSFTKVARTEDIPLLISLVEENSHPDLAYDLAALARRLPAINKAVAKPLLRLWDQLSKESKASYIFLLSRFKKADLLPFKNIMLEEFQLRKNSSETAEEIVAADILSILGKTLSNPSQFLKENYTPRAAWRILIGYLSLMKQNTERQNASDRILDLLGDSQLHPYVKDYILNNFAAFKVTNNVYSFLLLNESAMHYPALARRYPDQTIRYFSSHFSVASASDQLYLLQALFNTKQEAAIQKLSTFINEVPLAVRSKFVELATKTEIFKDSIYFDFLKENDLAISYFIADYAKKHKKKNFIKPLQNVFNAMDESSQVETMAKILDVLKSLGAKDSFKWASSQEKQISHHILRSKLHELNETIERTKKGAKKTTLDINAILSQEKHDIEIVMNEGRIRIKLDQDLAPIASYNIITLAKKGFYNGITFHRVVRNFVAQAGDPRGDGWGGPNYSIPCEYTSKRYRYGSVGMATAGKDTGSSQFFIMQRYAPHLDGKYTLFGHVVSGFDLLEKLRQGQKIYTINLL